MTSVQKILLNRLIEELPTIQKLIRDSFTATQEGRLTDAAISVGTAEGILSFYIDKTKDIVL